MELGTILASAGTSAVVSAVVSVMAVSQTTVRQLRATRADSARVAVAAAVAPLRLEVIQYMRSRRKSFGREADVANSADYQLASQILAASRDLRWWRRGLVRRRCRTLFSDYYVNIAEIQPADATSLGSFIAPLMQAQVFKDVEGTPTTGLLHRALSEPAGHRLQRKVDRKLRRLAACR